MQFLSASELNRMMQDGVTIVIRNNQPGHTVFQDDNTKVVTVWDAAGDPYGGDVKEVSPTLLANPTFREHLLRGVFGIVEAPEELERAVEGMRAKWTNQQNKAANAAIELEETKNQVVATAQTCIAPKGKELCGSYAIVMGKDPSERPPLCAEHMPLAGQYVPTETGREVDGKPEVVWKRAQLVRA